MSQEEQEKAEAISEVRRENQRTAKRTEQGTAYHETVTGIWFTDRQQHDVEVYAISSKQFRDAVREAKLTDLTDEKGELKRQTLLANMDFCAALAEAGTRDPKFSEKTLSPNDDAKITGKVLDLMKEPKN